LIDQTRKKSGATLIKSAINSFYESRNNHPFGVGIFVGSFIGILASYNLLLLELSSSKLEENIPLTTTITDGLPKNPDKQILRGYACSSETECLKEEVAIFIGSINKQSSKLFNDFLDDNTDITTICLGSPGGEVKYAKIMSNRITNSDLFTCMAEYFKPKDEAYSTKKSDGCLSSCNQLMLASKKRLRVGVNINFSGHAYAIDSDHKGRIFGTEYKLSTSRVTNNSVFINTLNEANTPDKMQHIKYANSVSNISHFNGMKLLNIKELLEYRIFTHECIDECVVLEVPPIKVF